jgi:salicylate hydroxylase
VYKRQDEAQAGAGIQLGPNATRLLTAWGLGHALGARAAFPEGIALHDGISGKVLARIPLGATVLCRYGAPYAVLHRADLHGLLIKAARAEPLIRIVSDCTVLGCGESDGGVRLVTTHGEHEGAALIGADGLRSTIRQAMAVGARLEPSALVAWRALIPAAAFPALAGNAEIGLWMRPGMHLVHYRVSGGAFINLVLVTPATDTKPARSGATCSGADRPDISAWPTRVRAVLAAVPEWTPWPLLGLAPLSRWSKGRIALLGDAAHAVLPFMASGSVLAIEDAAVFAHEVASTPDDLAAAFARYEAARRVRAERVRRASLEAGRIYHLGGAMRLARNAVLRASPPLLLLRRNDWLYGFRAIPGV